MTLRPIKILLLALMASLWIASIPTAYAQAPGGAELEVAPIEVGGEKAAEAPKEEPKPAAETVANPAEENPAGTAADMYAALKGGQWLIAFGGMLLFLVWGLRLLLVWLKVKWVSTRSGGYVLSFGMAVFLTVGTTLLAGEGFSPGLFAAALTAALAAGNKWKIISDAIPKAKAKIKGPKAQVVNE